MTFAMRNSPVLGASVLALAVLLAGCSGAPAPVATSAAPAPGDTVTPSPSVTPTPTSPAQQPETGESAPAQVFGGDCGKAFATADLRDILDSRVSFDEPGPGESLELAQAGGIGCIWRTGSYSTLVNVDLLPQDSIRSTTETAKCVKDDQEAPVFWRCEIEHQSGGIRMSGFFIVPDSFSKKKANAALDALVAGFEQSATADQAVPAPIPAADAWPNPVDCPPIAAAVDVRAIFNATPGLTAYQGGGDALPSPARVELWGDTFGLSCDWGTNKELTKKQLASGMTQNFAVTVLGGAAWAQDDLEKDDTATDVEIDGLDRVIRTRTSYGYDFAVIDGPNLLQFTTTTKNPGNAGEAAAAIVGFLNEQ